MDVLSREYQSVVSKMITYLTANGKKYFQEM